MPLALASSSGRGLIAVALLLALPVAAFVFGRPRPLPEADFRFVLPKENSTVDPALATSTSDGWIVQALFEGLLRLDPVDLRPRPAAASAHRVSEDGLTWTFSIDPAARWSDGEPVTAQDFLYAWRRVLSPDTGAPFASLLWVVEGAEAVSGGAPPEAAALLAADPSTFVVRLRAPCAFFAALVAHFSLVPVRRDLIERHGEAWTRVEHLVGNGCYRLAERRVRDRLRLVRNDRHPRAAEVELGVIDALAVESRATALNLYLTGAVDWVNGIPSAAVPHLRDREDLRLSTNLSTSFLRVNVTAPPLDDARVRRALDRMLDRAALCRYVYRGGETPARSLVPPSLPGYAPPLGPPEDVEAARRLLAEAGYPEGKGFPELELLHAADESARAVAEAIAARAWETLGIRLRAAPQEFKVYIDSQKRLKYQLCLANWVGDYPDPTTFLDLFTAASGGNRTGWREPRYDALLERAAAEVDVAQRERLLIEAEALLLAEGPVIPICYRVQPNLVRPEIEGFTDNLLDLHPLDRLRRRQP